MYVKEKWSSFQVASVISSDANTVVLQELRWASPPHLLSAHRVPDPLAYLSVKYT